MRQNNKKKKKERMENLSIIRIQCTEINTIDTMHVIQEECQSRRLFSM